MDKFNEAINQIDDAYAKQNSRLKELSEKLKEHMQKVNADELAVFDQLQAIIVREGGDVVKFKDGGRACSIEPLTDNGGVKITYKCDFGTSAKLTDATLPHAFVGNLTIDNFEELEKETKAVAIRVAVLDLANRVIETYISHQHGILNERNKVIDTITGDANEEESYW